MDQPTIIGIDLAKTVFQVHGVSADGTAVLRRQLRRGQVLTFFSRLDPCLIGMEACSGPHHWARELAALGHEVLLMPAVYVKPYARRGKTDRADAEGASREAVTRPTMRVMPEACLRHDAGEVGGGSGGAARPQGAGLPHPPADPRAVNAIRAHRRVRHCDGERYPQCRPAPRRCGAGARGRPTRPRPAGGSAPRSARPDRDGDAAHRDHPEVRPARRRLATILGLGPIASSAVTPEACLRHDAVTTPDVAAFRSARDYSAWLALTPKPHSSGGKERLGRISKGEAPNATRPKEEPNNRYLRRLLYLGAMAQIAARRRGRPGTDRLWKMLERKPVKVVAIALANRMARVVWARVRSGESYRAAPV